MNLKNYVNQVRMRLSMDRPAARRETAATRPLPKSRRLILETLEDRTLLSIAGFDTSFKVWQQNTQLRPDRLLSDSQRAFIYTAKSGGGFGLGGLVGAGFGALGAAATINKLEKSYDKGVPNTEPDNRERADILLGRAPTFDIISLQEVFDEDNLNQIQAGASSRDFQTVKGAPSKGFELNSGLALLLRQNFVTTNLAPQVFREQGPEGLPGDAPDRYAQKGFTVSRIDYGSDAYFYVVNSHLLADYPNKDNSGFRVAQLAQINGFVSQHTDPAHPVVFLGDFNVVAGSPEYQSMVSDLGVEDPFRDLNAYTSDKVHNVYDRCWNSQCIIPDNYRPERIDYILVRQGTEFQIEVQPDSRKLENTPILPDGTAYSRQQGWDPATVYLSDHFGISAQLHLTNRVAFDPWTGALTVFGGSADINDSITLSETGGEVLVHFDVGNQHYDRRFASNTVKSITVNTGKGNDRVIVDELTGPRTLVVNTGDDKDEIIVEGTSVGVDLTVNAGNQVDRVTIRGTVNQSATLNGDAGNDTISIDSASAGGAVITVNGGTENDRVVIADRAAGSRVVVDGGTEAGDTLVGPNAGASTWSVTGTNSGTLNTTISFRRVENLEGGSGNDTFRFTPGSAVAGNIEGQSGADTLDYSSLPGPITLNLETNTGPGASHIYGIDVLIGTSASDVLIGPAANNTWNITDNNTGSVISSFGGMTFRSFENLQGNWAIDTFVLSNGKGVTGSIDGGTGDYADTLDYSAWSGVAVDLTAGAASGVGGGAVSRVAGFEKVLGSPGSDTITGNASDNFLRGGDGADTLIGAGGDDVLLGEAGADRLEGSGGRDLLIGGTGGDALLGGEDDDLLIAGTTQYDAQDFALRSIMAEWTRGIGYQLRIDHLREAQLQAPPCIERPGRPCKDIPSPAGTAAGLNGQYFLKNSTVFSDGSVDSLRGDGGRDWFWYDPQYRGTGIFQILIGKGDRVEDRDLTPQTVESVDATQAVGRKL